ncbi:MAG: hypothetical protein ABDH21_00750 [bacterium]
MGLKGKPKKFQKALSIVEVVVSVTIIGLILSTVGLSFLTFENMRLSSQIRHEIQRYGEGILDYLCTLPLSDSHIAIVQNSPNNGILSLSDLSANPAGTDTNQILATMNSMLQNLASTGKFQIINNVNQGQINSRKGAIVMFNIGQNPQQSSVSVNTQGINSISITILYVRRYPNRRPPNNIIVRPIRITRILPM